MQDKWYAENRYYINHIFWKDIIHLCSPGNANVGYIFNIVCMHVIIDLYGKIVLFKFSLGMWPFDSEVLLPIWDVYIL